MATAWPDAFGDTPRPSYPSRSGAHRGAATGIRILIADDQPLVREGMAALLGRQSDMRVVAEAADGREAVELFREHRPDVTLTDLGLPRLAGLDAIRAIRRDFADARVIVVTERQGDEDVYQALQAGARGYLLKDAPLQEILDAIRAVHDGLKRVCRAAAEALAERLPAVALTGREREVLALMVEGEANRHIGARLGIAEATVKSHVNRILSKLAVSDRTQAVRAALHRGLAHMN